MGAWYDWSDCPVTCGVSSQSRRRVVMRHATGGGAVCGVTLATRTCGSTDGTPFAVDCPVSCVLSSWTQWSACTQSCRPAYSLRVGGNESSRSVGEQTSTRSVLRAAAFGGRAYGSMESWRTCSTHPCPADCQLTPWSAFGACSRTCGVGQQHSTRSLIAPAAFGGAPCSSRARMQDCRDQTPCATHCTVGDWTAWGGCSKSCYDGYVQGLKARTRSVVVAGDICPPLEQGSSCNAHWCPVDCAGDALADWGAWSTCTRSCSIGVDGTQQRTRALTPPSFGGRMCGDGHEHRRCGSAACDICQFSAFSAWSQCSRSCGSGLRQRTRAVLHAHGAGCSDATKELQACPGLAGCPQNCEMSAWGAWGSCTKSCGPCSRTRARWVVTGPSAAGLECPPLVQQQVCADVPQDCPVDCAVTPWARWGSVKGGERLLLRQRHVTRRPLYGGKVCPQLWESKAHGCSQKTIYGSWSQCSKKCGSGHRYRHREQTISSGVSTVN